MGEQDAIDKLNEQIGEKQERRQPPSQVEETVLLSEADQRYIMNEDGAVSRNHLEARLRRLFDNLVQGDGLAGLMETLLLSPHPDWKDDRMEYSYPNREFMRVIGTSSCLVFAIQDGTGRFQIYWNSKPGTSPVFLVGGEDAFKLLISTSGTFTLFWADGSGKSAGDAISWVTLFDVSGGGSNDLYYNGVKKLETTSAGAKVTGDLEVTGKVTVPVGTMYIQFNGKLAPSSLFLGTWTDRSSTWAGRFFRAVGGAAASFGTAQDDRFQGHAHQGGWLNVGSAYAESQYNQTNRYARAVVGASDATCAPAPVAYSSYGTPRIASETRPINYAIKIWERTA